MDARMRRDAYACPAPVPPGRRPTQPQTKSGIRVVSVDQIAFGFSIAGGIKRYELPSARQHACRLRGQPSTPKPRSRYTDQPSGRRYASSKAAGINTEV